MYRYMFRLFLLWLWGAVVGALLVLKISHLL